MGSDDVVLAPLPPSPLYHLNGRLWLLPPGTEDITGAMAIEATMLRAAARAGVPVPPLVSASGEPGELGAG